MSAQDGTPARARAPIILKLPEPAQLPPERVEAAYHALLRLVVRQVRAEVQAANDNAAPTVSEAGKAA